MKLAWRIQLGVLALIAVVAFGILPFRSTYPIASTPTETTATEDTLLATKFSGDPLDTPLLRRFFLKYGAEDPRRNTTEYDSDYNVILSSKRHPCSTSELPAVENHQTTEYIHPELIWDDYSSENENLATANNVSSSSSVSIHQKVNDLIPNSFDGDIALRPSPEKLEESTEALQSAKYDKWPDIKGQKNDTVYVLPRKRFVSSTTQGTWRNYHRIGSANTIRINETQDKNIRHSTVAQMMTQKCSASGVVTVQDGGRLGNKLWEYAAVWALGKLLELHPLVPKSILRHLGRYFKGLSVTALEDFLPTDCHVTPEALGEPMKRWRVLPLKSLKERLHLSSGGNLVLHRWIVLPEPVIAFLGKPLENEFHFHQGLINKAQKTLGWVANEVNILEMYNNCSNPEITFVGVHVRRTDFAQWLPRVYKKSLATASYFRQAMDYFRKKIEGPIAFIVVTDDIKWVKINLGAKQRERTEKLPSGLNDVFLGTNEKDHSSESIGHDLALLSLCNHTIIDYGTFGSWGALMAGGETISLHLDKHLDNLLEKHVPGWMLWDDPGIGQRIKTFI